jgi:predicted negative regulator of RcsB-dependent stress response
LAEDEELEAFKQWWKRNGQSILFGIVIAVLAVAGWQYWENREATARAEARQGFDSVIGTLSSDQDSEERLATMEYSLDNLKDKYPDSPYAVFSAMIAAGVYMDEGNPEAAAGELQWALDQAHQQPLPRVIRLRLARAQFASGNYEGVVETLQADNDAGEFSPLYRELEGDAQHALGNDQAARQAYQAARDSLGEDSNDRLLELKLSDLAAPEAS